MICNISNESIQVNIENIFGSKEFHNVGRNPQGKKARQSRAAQDLELDS